MVEGLQRQVPGAQIRNGAPIVRGCRMLNAPREIALMQYATNITIAAYRHITPRVRAGMLLEDITSIMKAATDQIGGRSELEMPLIGEESAYPTARTSHRTSARVRSC